MKQMKLSTLKNKFEKYCNTIDEQLENLDRLAEDFDEPGLSELLSQFTEKISAIVVSSEDNDINKYMIDEYIENELNER